MTLHTVVSGGSQSNEQVGQLHPLFLVFHATLYVYIMYSLTCHTVTSECSLTLSA